MDQRDRLAGEAEAYREGYSRALEIVTAERDTRRLEAYDRGYADGKHDERGTTRRVEWSTLFGLIVVGSVIGCGIILGVAVGLSHL